MGKAIPRLAERLRVPANRVDRLLIEVMERRARADEIDLAVLHEAHQNGPAASDWPNLVDLARDAAKDVLVKLLPNREPLLLTHLGLVSRYGLQPFIDTVEEATRGDDCEAIFFVLPAHDESTAAALEGLRIPNLLPSKVVRLTRDWIENRHNAAAPAA